MMCPVAFRFAKNERGATSLVRWHPVAYLPCLLTGLFFEWARLNALFAAQGLGQLGQELG